MLSFNELAADMVSNRIFEWQKLQYGIFQAEQHLSMEERQMIRKIRKEIGHDRDDDWAEMYSQFEALEAQKNEEEDDDDDGDDDDLDDGNREDDDDMLVDDNGHDREGRKE